MSDNGNAWPEIEKWLRIRRRTQRELAERLGLSDSAVTQIKKGSIRLHAEQLRSIFEFLNVDDEGIDEVCGAIFQARFGAAFPDPGCRVRIFRRAKGCHWPPAGRMRCDAHTVPLVEESVLRWYEPALESLRSFVARTASETSVIDGEGDFVMRGDSPGNEMLVLVDSRPVRSGDTVLAKLRDGQVVRGVFSCVDGRASLYSDGELRSWICGRDKNFFLWACPVAERA